MKRALKVLAVLAAILVAAFLIFRVPDTDAAAMRAKYGGPPSQFVSLKGGPTIHLRDEGPRDAPVIVLLHGSNADLHTWDAWTRRLTARYRVIRFDQRGHGLTGAATDGNYGRTAFAQDVERVADTLNLDRFTLAGNSMGGGIALDYALHHPERLEGLVLVDAAGAPISERGKGNLAFTLARMPGVGRALSALLPRELIAKSLSQSVSNQAVVTEAAIDRYWELARYPGNREATSARFAAMPEPFPAAAVSKLDVPTLILWGEKDPLIPLAAGQWFARTLPRAKLIVYPGIGHIPMEEAADRSADDLASWLSGLAESEPAAALEVQG